MPHGRCMRAAYALVPGHEYQRGRFIKLVLSLTVSLQAHGAADADLGDSDLSADQCCAGGGTAIRRIGGDRRSDRYLSLRSEQRIWELFLNRRGRRARRSLRRFGRSPTKNLSILKRRCRARGRHPAWLAAERGSGYRSVGGWRRGGLVEGGGRRRGVV